MKRDSTTKESDGWGGGKGGNRQSTTTGQSMGGVEGKVKGDSTTKESMETLETVESMEALETVETLETSIARKFTVYNNGRVPIRSFSRVPNDPKSAFHNEAATGKLSVMNGPGYTISHVSMEDRNSLQHSAGNSQAKMAHCNICQHRPLITTRNSRQAEANKYTIQLCVPVAH